MIGCRGARASLGVLVAIAHALVGCGDAADPETAEITQAIGCGGSEVTFAGCTEFAGIGFVPAANARPLVPAEYELMGDEDNAVIVVRVADCDEISVDGKKPKAGTVSQVGINVVPVDPTADINNYTLWLGTNLGQLHGKLRSLGIPAEMDADLAYTFSPSGSAEGVLSIAASPPRGPRYSVSGTATVPTDSPVPFVATWWSGSGQGAMGMRTEFPEIRFGAAEMTLTTPSGSRLATLIGGTTLEFALLDSYNTFDAATLTIDPP